MRQGVGVIVLNQNNEVFVAKRKDNPIDKWQMPQGGININETPYNAMKRELEEETSITTIKVLINLNTKHPEFIEWKWINYKSLTDVIVDFKKDVYRKLKNELKNFFN